MQLRHQIKSLHVVCEILLIDDCSQEFKTENQKLAEHNTYIELPQNIGRAKIRNLFLNYAKYGYLLFLDCDSLINNPNYLSNYLQTIKKNPNVVCGGRSYEVEKPSRAYLLRWKYGVYKESQPYLVRQQHPNKSFMTNNFLIRKSLLETIRFDERIVQYGHEDTLFGYALKKNNIAITHINNAVINGDVERNEVFLHKTNQSIISLIAILQFKEFSTDLGNEITLLRFYTKVKKIDFLLRFLFTCLKPLLVYTLTKGYVSLVAFDFYKLGTLIENTKATPVKI